MSDLNEMLNGFVNLNEMVAEVEKKDAKKFWRPVKPKTTIRFLPPIKSNGEKLPWIEHRVHWINSQPYECLNQTLVDKDGNMHTAEPCPICKMAKALYAAKTDNAVELAKNISAKTRYIARVLVKDGSEDPTTPVFYELPFSINQKFQTAIVSQEWGSLVGPLDGRDFDIAKSGEGKFTNYDASSFKPMVSKIADTNEAIISVLQKTKEMSYNSLITFKNAEELKEIAFENDDIASFFAPAQSKAEHSFNDTPQRPAFVQPIPSAPAQSTPIDPMEDLIPTFTGDVETTPLTNNNDASAITSSDLDALIASLV